MAFENFPYTDFHALNLDWVLLKVKELEKLGKDVEYIKNYFKNLNVQDEINNKLDDMLADGSLDEVIERTFAAIRNYTSADRAMNVLTVKDTIVQTLNATRTYEVEALVLDDVKLGYIAPTQSMNIDMPVTNAAVSVSIDSYNGSCKNVRLVNRSTVQYKPVFISSSVPSEGILANFTVSVIGRHATPNDTPINPVFPNRGQIVEVAETYYQSRLAGREYAYGRNFVNSALSNTVNDENGRGVMECDTFVSLVLLGVKYNQSLYNNTTPNYTANFEQLPENPNNYSWVLPWRNNDVLGRKVTWTGGQNWYLWNSNSVYKNPAHIADGDIAIFTKDNAKFFDGIAHIGILKMVGSTPYIYHFTGSSEVESPMMYEPLANVIQRGNYDNDHVYFARPAYE